MHHLSLSKHGTRDPEVSISLQINGFPTNRHWASAVTTTISPCCKASIWGSSSCLAHQLLAKLKKSSRVNRLTAEVPTLLQRVEYKIPNMGRKHLRQFSDPPFIAGQHMLLPPTSAQPISQHCPAERPAPHSARRARPMQPCPATASRGRSWRLPALSTGSSCSARCSPPNQRYNWIANKLSNKSIPKKYTPKRKIRRGSTNSNSAIHGQLSLYTSWCISPDWNPWNASWQLKCTQTFQTQTSRFYWLSMRACGWA